MGELYMHTDIGPDRAVCIKQSFKKLHIPFVVCIALSVPSPLWTNGDSQVVPGASTGGIQKAPASAG
jgi:hypothetical protein